MTRLPRSIDELHGLRAARWIRESTRGQFDNFGPEAQREAQTRAIARQGMVDSGLEWKVAHSGRTVGLTAQFGAMLEAAGREYDVLVVGYVSRFARDLRTAVNARHELHAAGAALLFCEERVLSSDEDAWDAWAREAVEAESYSRRLSRNIKSGYASKFRTMADQAGRAPLGFRRSPNPPHVLEVDPETIRTVVEAFVRYSSGSVSEDAIARAMGLGLEQVAKALRNPLYNGWVRRHRGADEERRPAPWRADPPISDELWERVADLRARRRRGGGPSTRNDVDLLRGLLFCRGCGRRLRANGTNGTPPRRSVAHPDPCPAWGAKERRGASTWEIPIEAQWSGIPLDASTLRRVRAVVEAPVTQPTDTTRVRIERQMRDLGADHLAQRVDDATYLARLAVLREEAKAAATPRRARVSGDAAVRQLADMARAWRRMSELERAKLTHAVYSRIEVVGDSPDARIVLTPAAYEIGLDQALPESVNWRPRQESRQKPDTAHLEIVGRRERARMARSA